MNIHDRETNIDEARWQAQEKARRGDADADALDLRIAQALRRAPVADLPFDFATRVARLARAQAAVDARFEQRLLRGLVIVFAVSAAVVVAWFGRGWVADLGAVLPGGQGAVGWTAAAAVCALANWGFGALRRHVGQGTGTLA